MPAIRTRNRWKGRSADPNHMPDHQMDSTDSTTKAIFGAYGCTIMAQCPCNSMTPQDIKAVEPRSITDTTWRAKRP